MRTPADGSGWPHDRSGGLRSAGLLTASGHMRSPGCPTREREVLDVVIRHAGVEMLGDADRMSVARPVFASQPASRLDGGVELDHFLVGCCSIDPSPHRVRLEDLGGPGGRVRGGVCSKVPNSLERVNTAPGYPD